MDKAECKRRGIPWPLGECISGSADFVSRNEERYDFPCSQVWRDFYSERPREPETHTVEVHHDHTDKQYQSVMARLLKLEKRKAGGVQT